MLSTYGAHRWYLVWLYRRHRRPSLPPAADDVTLPSLTVQLPLFNEMYVAERLIDAVCRLDYPRHLLQIQVLDDSTDETTRLVEEVVERKRRLGFDIQLLHRDDRSGFKAGALAAGLASARGEMIAIFDADFAPEPGFARALVPYFEDAEIGMVQARWGHINAHHSALTRIQSMFLDGHFVIEHTARNRSGRFFNFNGTAGVWRRACIDDAGGWQHDTLTEDLDLSYRAQLRGWKFVYVPEHVAPAELPVEMTAFKTQQHRWAKGSIQTAKKLLPEILRSRLPFRIKLEATVHLTANIGYLLMVLLAVLIVPAVWYRSEISHWWVAAVDLPLFTLSTLSVAAFYGTAQSMALGGRWRGTLRWLPALMALGIGLSINNCRAVIEALVGHKTPFRRTPKYNLQSRQALSSRRYRGSVNLDTVIESLFSIYFGGAVLKAMQDGLWGAVPFLLLFALGYGYTSILTLVQASRTSRLTQPQS
ncbi:MAG: glycosyltransferase [Acidobacteriota bacterium]|nr:glycosyltransferase [Acidobacteriota bacterium]